MQTEHRVAANPQTKPVDLGCESAENWQLSSTSTIAVVIITQPVSWYSLHHLHVRSMRTGDCHIFCLLPHFLAYFGEVRISHIFRVNWRFRRQFWYYLCVYYRLVLGFVLLNHYYSLFHSRLKTLIPFLRIFPTAAFLFFFRTDYMDSPDCLLLLISVFTFEFFFLFYTF